MGHIDVYISLINSFSFRFMRFYGNPRPELRKHYSDLLKCLHFMSSLPWHVVGDFNEIFFPNEKIGRDRNSWQIDNFRNVLTSIVLIDLGFEGPKHTWKRKRLL